MQRPSLGKPSPASLEHFLVPQKHEEFTYAAIGATSRQESPAGYNVNHVRQRLGTGEHCFRAAQSAIRNWEQFQLGWLEAWPVDTPIREGERIALIAQLGGIHWLNACRIVYVVEDVVDGVVRFGFAYGTLPDHAAAGEERFLIEWDRRDDTVWYDIFAFSRLRGILSHLGYPLLRRAQERFRRDSCAAMTAFTRKFERRAFE